MTDTTENGSRVLQLTITVILLAVAGIFYTVTHIAIKRNTELPALSSQKKTTDNAAAGDAVSSVKITIESRKVIDLINAPRSDSPEAMAMAERKARFNIQQGVDIVASPGEALRIGDTTVTLQEIIDETQLAHGQFIERPLEEKNADARASEFNDFQGVNHTPLSLADLSKPVAPETEPIDQSYGIHLVKNGDNLWNIHFQLLKEYFEIMGVRLSQMEDEPLADGRSSGVGRLLKFSEYMVTVYNVEEKRVETDLDLIEPNSKIVIYHMGKIFALLNQIDYSQIDEIKFDGETLWLPSA